MQHTLIAVFDNHNDAVGAKNELIASGFATGDVRLSHGDETAPGGSMASGALTGDDEPGIGASIRNFFSDIFGTDSDEHGSKYASAVERGNHVLTVKTDSEPEVERAADIVERFGPIDIDEQSEKWAGGAAIGGNDALRTGAMTSAGNMGGGASTSLQFDNDRLPLNQQSLNDPNPMGTTYQEPSGNRDQLSVGSYGSGSGAQQRDTGIQGGSGSSGSSSGAFGSGGLNSTGASTLGAQGQGQGQGQGQRDFQRGGMRVYSRDGASTGSYSGAPAGQAGTRSTGSSLDLDDDYRKHYSSTYGADDGSYDDYAPAYGYGAEMRSHALYQNRSWDEVEPNLRSDWEQRNAGTGLSWEKMKAAVRHGWNKITH
jgi:hypothetical protein